MKYLALLLFLSVTLSCYATGPIKGSTSQAKISSEDATPCQPGWVCLGENEKWNGESDPWGTDGMQYYCITGPEYCAYFYNDELHLNDGSDFYVIGGIFGDDISHSGGTVYVDDPAAPTGPVDRCSVYSGFCE